MREPDAHDSAQVLAIVLALLFAIGLAAGRVRGDDAQLALTAAMQLAFFAVPLVYARAARMRPFAASGFARLSWRQVGLVLLACCSALWIIKAIYDAQSAFFAWAGLDTRAEVAQLQDRVGSVVSRGKGLALILLAVVPALCEETLFRGLVLRGMGRSFSPARAVVYMALLFAAIHGKVEQSALMLFNGLYFGTLVALTGSLWAGVIAHGVNNAAVVVVSAWVGRPAEAVETPPALVALSAVVFGLALALLAMEPRRRLGKGSVA
jgi:membrane protease YdiL (CAAX protease family)